jgi:hypothetical protein
MKPTPVTILALASMLTLVTACDCEAPDEYQDATLDGCSEAGDTACCSYSSDRCAYVLCSSSCGEWDESSWYCW